MSGRGSLKSPHSSERFHRNNRYPSNGEKQRFTKVGGATCASVRSMPGDGASRSDKAAWDIQSGHVIFSTGAL